MTNEELHAAYMKEVQDIKGSIHNIYKILNGNGKTGLKTEVDRNTQFRKEAQVGLRGSYLAMIGIWIKSFFG